MPTTATDPAARPPLTDRQRAVLAAIVTHTANTGAPPAIRDICRLTGIASTNGVVHHLEALAAKGYIEWDRTGASRGATVPELRRAQYAAGVAYLERLAG